MAARAGDVGSVVAEIPARAAGYVERHLWTRSALTVRDRRRLIALAVLRSAPSPAVAHLVLQVFRRTDACAAWHGSCGPTTDELAFVLRDTVITERHLEQASCAPRSGALVDVR